MDTMNKHPFPVTTSKLIRPLKAKTHYYQAFHISHVKISEKLWRKALTGIQQNHVLQWSNWMQDLLDNNITLYQQIKVVFVLDRG